MNCECEMKNYPQGRPEYWYKFNIHHSALHISDLDADEGPVRADRLHRPLDIFVGESQRLSPFRLSGEEKEIVYGEDALEYPVFIRDREPSDFFPFHDVHADVAIRDHAYHLALNIQDRESPAVACPTSCWLRQRDCIRAATLRIARHDILDCHRSPRSEPW